MLTAFADNLTEVWGEYSLVRREGEEKQLKPKGAGQPGEFPSVVVFAFSLVLPRCNALSNRPKSLKQNQINDVKELDG